MSIIARDYGRILPGVISQTSTCGFRADPVTGKIRPHSGVDLGAPEGSPVYVPKDGVVEQIGYQENGFGHYIVIRHAGPGNATTYSIYAHLQESPSITIPGLEKESPVPADSQIGSSGNSGGNRTTGPHLHYEERIAVPDANGTTPTWDKAWPIDPDQDLTGMDGGTPGLRGSKFFSPCIQDLNEIPPAVPSNFTGAQRTPQYRDPLTFDLDGDGIETVGIDPNSPILFDHDGDGLKTATGWVASDDAFLVLDRNGNGTIDNGSELFGDSTPLLAGGNAADGFAALAQEDTNSDGKVDSNDARFSQLRLWQDLNQDGISQAGELFTLAAKGIAAITVQKTENNTLLPSGNVLADVGSYTKTDGTTGTLGDIGHLGDVDLREETFYSQFTDAVPLTPEAQALPDMHGSGQVRDLQEAASLSTDLTMLLQQYAAAPTRAEQVNMFDALLKGWSDTSTMKTTTTGAYDGHPLTIIFEGVAAGSAQYNDWLNKLTLLERFNGRSSNNIFCKMQTIHCTPAPSPLAA